MILQDEFRDSGYTDLLTVDAAKEYGLDPEGLFDSEQQPGELLGIFISRHGDELFFLLRGDKQDVKTLCDRWDDRIRVFSILNSSNDAFKKLKYNIVQLIVYSGAAPDRSREGDLQITRKIIIKGDLKDEAHIVIGDDEAIELPFHMIPPDAFAPDAEQTAKLHRLLPTEPGLLDVMKTQREQVKKKKGAAVQPKYYQEQDFNKIKEWLET